MVNLFKLYAWADYFRWLARVRWLNSMGCFSPEECGMYEPEYDRRKKAVLAKDELVHYAGYWAAMRLGLGPAGQPGEPWSIYDRQNCRWVNGHEGSIPLLALEYSVDMSRAWRLHNLEMTV